MQSDSIHDVIKDVFGPNTYAKTIGGWVSMHCPLAPWTHERGADHSPSAGVSVNDSVSVFNCFTCHKKMPFSGMLRQYAEYTGEDLDDVIEEIDDEGYLGPRELPSWQVLRDGNEVELLMPIDESIYMDLYDSAVGHPYLRERGISDETARKLELLFDPEDSADKAQQRRVTPRILFPVRGPDGLLYGFSGRDTTGKSKLKVRDYNGLKKALCLLGSHLITSENPDKVLVGEGLFDYANGWQQGYPFTSVMHSTCTDAQADILRGFGKPVYLFYDDDQAGADGAIKAGNALRDYVPTMKVRYPDVWIENPNERDGGHWLKDPGELEAEDFAGMIKDARLF